MLDQKPLMVCLVRRADGKIRCTMPDGSTRYVTDEEWPEVYRMQREHAQKEAKKREIETLRRRLATLEAQESET